MTDLWGLSLHTLLEVARVRPNNAASPLGVELGGSDETGCVVAKSGRV